jgi:hypothetical protein
MSVGKLTEALRKEWFADNHTAQGKEKSEARFSIAHKEWKKAEPKMNDFTKDDPTISQYGLGEALKEQELPKWLSDKTLKWSIESLAKARCIEPHVLVRRAVQDFIDVHADELGNLGVAEEKRRAEENAAQAARNAVLRERMEEQQREKDKYFAAFARAWERMGPIDAYEKSDHVTVEFKAMRYRLTEAVCNKRIDQIQALIPQLLEMLPLSDAELRVELEKWDTEDDCKAEAQACEYRPQTPEPDAAEIWPELQEKVTASKIAEPSHDEKLTVDGHKYHWVDGPTQGGTATRTGWYTTYNCFAHHDHTQETIMKAWTELQEVTA